MALGLVEGRGTGELADRERGKGVSLVGGAQRLAVLAGLEVVAFAPVDDQRDRDRSDGDRGNYGKAEPETEAHGSIVGGGSTGLNPPARLQATPRGRGRRGCGAGA